MARFVVSLMSSFTPQKAFAYMADARNFAAWDPSVVRAVVAPGHAWPDSELPRIGTCFDIAVKTLTTTTLRYTITELEPLRRIVFEARTPFLRSFDEVGVLASANGGCLVTYDARLELRGPLRLGNALLARAFRTLGEAGAAGLKRALQ
jgi:hypothetical protein